MESNESANEYLERLHNTVKETSVDCVDCEVSLDIDQIQAEPLIQLGECGGYGRPVQFGGQTYILTAAHVLPCLEGKDFDNLGVINVLVSKHYLQSGSPDIAFLQVNRTLNNVEIDSTLREIELGDIMSCMRSSETSKTVGIVLKGNVQSICRDAPSRFNVACASAPGQSGAVLSASSPMGVSLGVLHGFTKHRLCRHLQNHKHSYGHVAHTPFVYINGLSKTIEVYRWEVDFYKKKIRDIYCSAEVDDIYAEYPNLSKAVVDNNQPATVGNIHEMKGQMDEMKGKMDEMKGQLDEMMNMLRQLSAAR